MAIFVQNSHFLLYYLISLFCSLNCLGVTPALLRQLLSPYFLMQPLQYQLFTV